MDMSKYKSMFVNEAREHLGQMDVAAAQLRSSPASRELIDQLFRQAHSIKGMAAAMEYTEISELAHGVEDMLSEFREGAKAPGPEVLGLLVEAIDTLSVQVDARTEEGAPKEAPALLEKIRGVTGGAPVAAPLSPKAAPEPPKPAPKASSAPSAGSLFEIRFSLSVTGTMAGLRGFLVYKRLGSAGPIESVDPDLPQLKGGNFRGPV
ncbi:MAG: Hpt domain-containing protein, partial [Bdellovibrionota bacterium]